MNGPWKNRGMLLEQLLNRTIQYYEANSLGLFEKRSVPVSFKRTGPNGRVSGKIIGYAKVDYLGYAKGRYFEFEAKQTKNDFLLMSAFQEHQLQRLQTVMEHGGTAFAVIGFEQCEAIHLVPATMLLALCKSGAKRISRLSVEQKCPRLEIQTPGIIDFLAVA